MLVINILDASDEVVTQLTENKLFYYSKRPCYNAYKFFNDEMLLEKQSCSFLDIETSEINVQQQKKMKFVDLFWEIFQQKGYQLPPAGSRLVYMFEMSTELQRLVIARGMGGEGYVDRLVLHGVRDMDTLKELEIEPIAQEFKWECAKRLFEGEEVTADILIQSSTKLDPIECCGYVLRDKNFNRLKLKSPQYVALRKLVWNSDDPMRNRRLMLQIVRTNDCTNFLKR